MTGRKGQLIRSGIALGLLAILLATEKDVLDLVHPRYVLPARVLLLVLAGLLGGWSIREGMGAVFRTWDRQSAFVWRKLGTWILYLMLGLVVLSTVGVNLSGLLVGGAILGVVLATIAQPSLGNFFAGLVLMLARPYHIGSLLALRGPLVGGVELEGTVSDIGALFTTLTTRTGDVLKLPNTAVLGSALTIRQAAAITDFQLTLLPGTQVEQVSEAIRARLEYAAPVVVITPEAVDLDKGVVCHVEVRASEAVDPLDLAKALQALGRDEENPAA